MSPQYLSPGVYVEEVERGARPIEGVGTAVAAFTGFTERGPVNKPTFIANWTQFINTFGGFIPGGYLAAAVYGYFHNGGGGCYIVRVPAGEGSAEAGPSQLAIPSQGDRTIGSLLISSYDAGVPLAEITVDVSEPSEGAPEDQFTLKIRYAAKEETYENVTLKRTKGSRNVIEVATRESKLVRIAERESNLSLAERTPVTGTYTLATTSSQAITAVSPEQIIGDVAARTGIAGLEVAEDVTMI